MPTLPVRDVIWPSSIAGYTNGRLPSSVLVTVPCLYRGADVRLCAPAARAWVALRAAAAKAGHQLKATSAGDSYRSYEQQHALFLSRYTTTPNGRYSVWWAGRRWYLLPGKAIAAVPGTSTHGKAITVDVGEERDADAAAEPIDDPTLAWLLANAHLYGFSWELQVEIWHIRYVNGDTIPAAVLAYEQEEDVAVKFLRATVDGEVQVWVCNGPLRSRITGGPTMVKAALAVWGQTEQDIVNAAPATLEAAFGRDVATLGGSVDVVLTAVDERVDDRVADALDAAADAVRAD